MLPLDMSDVFLPLHLRGVAESTRRVYSRAVSSFILWATINHPSFSISSSSESVIDSILAEYVNSLFIQNPSRGNLQIAINCRAGILLTHPAMSTRLPLTLASTKGWDKTVQRSQRPPMPSSLVFVMIRFFIRRSQLQWALITWMGFDGYFRISELFNRVPEDFMLQDNVLAVYLDKSKTGRHQSVVISQPQLIQLYNIYVSKEKFFYVSLHGYREAWNAMLASLNAADLGLAPHSLRHGGATHDYLTESRSLEQIIL